MATALLKPYEEPIATEDVQIKYCRRAKASLSRNSSDHILEIGRSVKATITIEDTKMITNIHKLFRSFIDNHYNSNLQSFFSASVEIATSTDLIGFPNLSVI